MHTILFSWKIFTKMSFRRFDGKIEDLKPLLDENIFDGEFSKDVAIALLREKYIERLSSRHFDIMQSGNDLLIGHVLEWDSAYMGFPCYKISYLHAHYSDFLLSSIHDFLKEIGIQMALLRLSTGDPLRLYIPMHHSFRLCATKVMYRKELTATNFRAIAGDVCLEILADMPVLRREKAERKINMIAPNLFSKNRFMTDDKISHEKALGVYREWIKNTIKERKQDIYCLTDSSGELCAFSVIKFFDNFERNFALLELIGALVKGKNFGSLILSAIESKLVENRQNIFYANTNILNYSAQNLFCRNGFTSYHSVDEYHWWVN